jgi:uncharacterized glyoxalase superfamily protein PhnB
MSTIPPDQSPVAEVFPLLWSDDVAAIVDWAVNTLGLSESWRAPNEAGVVEHAELDWPGGKVSINITRPNEHMGPTGISLRIDDRAQVDTIYAQAVAAGASITQPLADSPIAYSFTATDQDGNQWWVNAETGFLDELRR